MVTVKFFGLLRVESGIKSVCVEADSVKTLYAAIMAELRRIKPDCGITEKDLRTCTLSVNGARCTARTRLCDGDTVILIPAAAGG